MIKKWLQAFKTPPHLKTTLPAPHKPEHLPAEVQWLSGEGAGSWFHAEKEPDAWLITRYSPEGNMECRGRFQALNALRLQADKPFSFVHISHCQTVHLLQDGVLYKLQRTEQL